MSGTAAVVEALKRTLRARRITYARVAHALGLSEASMKRMFSRGHFTLDRFERVCELAGTSLTELAREIDSAGTYISQLTLEQEREIVRDRKLLLVAVCAVNHLTLEQICDIYQLTRAECTRLLLRLDRIKLLELLPNNRIRLLITPTFSWLPDGPIQQYFKARAQLDYFRSRFDGPEELLLLSNGMLSHASAQAMLSRLKRIANEFAELHGHDAELPLGERRPSTLVVALRPWELDEFRELRRRKRG